MTNFTNMKIPVEGNLEEIVAELKRIGLYVGFIDDGDAWISARPETMLIVSFECESHLLDSHWKLTTLAELKAIK